MALGDYDHYKLYRQYGNTSTVYADPNTWTSSAFQIVIDGRPVQQNPYQPNQSAWYDTARWVQVIDPGLFEPDRTLLSDNEPDMDAD
jgi:hypothetical protein